MTDRFGYDSDEGLIFDRTKPYTKGEDSEGLYEEVTLPELIEHANSLSSKLGTVEKERDALRREIERTDPRSCNKFIDDNLCLKLKDHDGECVWLPF